MPSLVAKPPRAGQPCRFQRSITAPGGSTIGPGTARLGAAERGLGEGGGAFEGQSQCQRPQ